MRAHRSRSSSATNDALDLHERITPTTTRRTVSSGIGEIEGAFEARVRGSVVAGRIDVGQITSSVFVGPTGQVLTCTDTLPRFRHLSETLAGPRPRGTSRQPGLTKHTRLPWCTPKILKSIR